jgi:hypothetical protein
MGEIRRTVHAFGYLLRTQMLVELQYRVNLFVQLFQSCDAVCASLVVIDTPLPARSKLPTETYRRTPREPATHGRWCWNGRPQDEGRVLSAVLGT